MLRQLLSDNLQRWSSESNSNDDDNDDAMDDDDDDVDDGNEQPKAANGTKQMDEDLENSIFVKLGQAQPIPPSEIPDFEERYEF